MAETEQITEIADTPDDAVGNQTPIADNTADLNALLAEFEAGTSVDQLVDPVARQSEILAQREGLLGIGMRRLQEEGQAIQDAERQLRAQEDARDEVEALRAIRGSLDLGDEDVQGFIVGRVLKDPAINDVWQNRREDRAAYNRMVARLHGDLQQHEEQRRQKILSREATVDAFAVAQAVRGASQKVAAEPPPDFARMSDRELQQWKNENMR